MRKTWAPIWRYPVCVLIRTADPVQNGEDLLNHHEGWGVTGTGKFEQGDGALAGVQLGVGHPLGNLARQHIRFSTTEKQYITLERKDG